MHNKEHASGGEAQPRGRRAYRVRRSEQRQLIVDGLLVEVRAIEHVPVDALGTHLAELHGAEPRAKVAADD